MNSYCKVAHDDPRVVRGARNFPCPNSPTRRSATAAGCGLVFQKVDARSLLDQSSLATYDPKSGVVMTPDGTTALFSQLGDGSAPASWQDLLVGLVR
jgi:phospholipid/cholesterol/gamma-HCH transport system substrate-binding protein